MTTVRCCRVSVAAVLLLAFAASVHAQIIFNNLGLGDSFNTVVPGVGIGKTPAPVLTYAGAAFTPQGRNYVLTKIELALQLISGPNELDVYVMGDAGGSPSGVIETMHLSNGLTSGHPALTTVYSVQRPMLLAGRQYWLVAAGGSATFAVWSFNSINITGPIASGSGLNTLLRATSNSGLAFRITENRITGLSPSSVIEGGPQFTLTVNGINLTSSMSVLFNGVRLATTYLSPAQLTAVVPAALIGVRGAAIVNVDDYGSSSLTILPAPQPSITNLSPTSAIAGGADFTLAVTGAGFLFGARVRWSGTELSSTYLSSSQLTAIVPARLIANPGPIAITVANSIAEISNSLDFAVSCSYILRTTKATAPDIGGAGSVAISTGGNCSWIAVSNAAWVTIAAGANGTGGGTVFYSVAANGGLDRTATLSIGGQIFTISQLAAQPSISEDGILNAANFRPEFASGTWVIIRGTNLSTTTRTWVDSDFAGNRLPTLLDGVRVDIDGKPAYVYSVSPEQVEILAPEDAIEGPVPVELTNVLGRAGATGQKQAIAPGLFTVTVASRRYVAARFADGTLVGRPEIYPDAAARPARPGDSISLFATGLGPTDPAYPDGEIIRSPSVLKNLISIQIGGAPAPVDFVGVEAAGVYLIKLTVPDTPDGDNGLTLQVPGFDVQDDAYVPVQRDTSGPDLQPPRPAGES